MGTFNILLYFFKWLYIIYKLCRKYILLLIHFQLEQKQVTPPYKPRLDSDRDLANFPPEFTDEPVHLTPDDP